MRGAGRRGGDRLAVLRHRRHRLGCGRRHRGPGARSPGARWRAHSRAREGTALRGSGVHRSRARDGGRAVPGRRRVPDARRHDDPGVCVGVRRLDGRVHRDLAHGAPARDPRLGRPGARAEVLRIEPDRTLTVRVSQKAAGTKGAPSEWAPGDYQVRARIVVAAAGAIGTPALLLRSPLPAPRSLGHGFTCHPALILVAEHPHPITNDVGHPNSYFVDHGASERFVLETCMYFPFVTAKSLTGFGAAHSAIMHAFPRLQMILILACDHVASGNRIAVSRAGSPVVHYRFTRETIDGLVRGTRAAARIFFAAGARRVHAPADPPYLEAADAGRLEERITARHFRPGLLAVSAAHLMGGSGMGRSAADSVTDAWGRVHGLPWLRVADASLFPNSLEINPYLTIMGLADRVAEGVRRDVAVARD